MEKRRILAVGAHAGDMEISCGAVLLKEINLDNEVHLLHLSLGGRGHFNKSSEEYSRQKKEEALECASRMVAKVHFLDYQDGEIPDSIEARLAVTEVIRKVQPSVVIAHWRSSLHPDHTAAHQLADIAVLWAALEGIGQSPVWRGNRRLLFTENWEDPEGFKPYLYVDVSDFREPWLDAVQAYELFRGGVSSFDYVGYYDGLGKVRGSQVGAKWAEAFGVFPWQERQKIASVTG